MYNKLVVSVSNFHLQSWQLRSYDRDHCRITLNSGVFLWPDRYTRANSQVFELFTQQFFVESITSKYYNNNIIIYKCLDRATTMPQEDFLMGPVVKNCSLKYLK